MCDDHVILTTTTIYETNNKLQTKLARIVSMKSRLRL